MDKENLTIEYKGKQWTGKVNSKTLSTGGKNVNLVKPIIQKNNRALISLDDLQTVLGFQIVYNPNVQKFFSARATTNAAN